MKELNKKYYPEIGTKLYLQQCTGNGWADMVKRPYTVIEVKPSKIIIQEAALIFNGPRYFDTLPDDIVEDKNGNIEELHWSSKHQMWQIDKYHTGYPSFAHFGAYKFQPYLN